MVINEKIAIMPNKEYFDKDEKSNPDFSELSLSRYYKFIKSFEFLESSGEILMFISDFVLNELLFEYSRNLESQIKKFNKQKAKLQYFIKSDCDLNVDIKQHCEHLKDKYEQDLNTIEVPNDFIKLFDEIFRMAINKEPPFLHKKSDRGFKDAILLLSFFEFARKNHYDKYILILEGLTEEDISEIQNKFSTYSCRNKNKLQIIDEKRFENWFNEEYGLYVELRQIIEEKLIPEVEFNYSRNADIQIGYNNFHIDYCDFIKKQTRIYQESENIFDVEVYFSIDLNFSGHHPDELYGMEDMDNVTQRECYLFEKIDDNWVCSLCDYDYSIYYEPYEEYDDHYPFQKIREKFNIKMPDEFSEL